MNRDRFILYLLNYCANIEIESRNKLGTTDSTIYEYNSDFISELITTDILDEIVPLLLESENRTLIKFLMRNKNLTNEYKDDIVNWFFEEERQEIKDYFNKNNPYRSEE